jgi:hypothetical protein
MQTVHSLPLQSKAVFMGTTSSCDSENHAITFLLTPREAGAVPLAVFIASGQRQADYETSFHLLKQVVGENLFGAEHYPEVFITDASSAEQNAIKSTFPQSGSKIYLFHAAQAIWRWLWILVNKVALSDRKTLMQEFQSITRNSSVEQSELIYKEACDSPTSKKYGHWRTYLQSHWEKSYGVLLGEEQKCVAIILYCPREMAAGLGGGKCLTLGVPGEALPNG